ncbi:MAG: sporulation protein [Alcaligenaceae bacterium]|nr:MAG: sporulation protein [Alcaligenaceae bacterium]
MGLFSRKDSAAPRKPPGKVRPSVSSEAQAAELRVKARRRLAGAVALVLAAVVILPMLLDSKPAPVSSKIPIKIPDRNTPFQANLTEPAAVTDAASVTPAVTAPASAAPPASGTPPVATTSVKPDPKLRTEPAAKPVPPNAPATRSDDGVRALALLDGRPTVESTSPPGTTTAPKAPTSGNFVVQASSLDGAADAQTQKNKLLAAGVSNAFVDGPVEVNGKTKYRVRVGPFPSKEAALATQARLRTLGFADAYIPAQ